MTDFTGYHANIYDENGDYKGNINISHFDKQEKTIEVPDLPENIIGKCEVVILTAPTPFAFKGTVRKFGGTKLIALYEGHSKEQRKTTRYKTSLPGVIEHLVFDEKRYRLHSPMSLQIINISKRGLRLRGKTNDLIKGLRPRIRINVGKGDQILTADVMNVMNKDDDVAEFGCALYSPKLIHDDQVQDAVSAPASSSLLRSQ